jgi:hypothetical protein
MPPEASAVSTVQDHRRTVACASSALRLIVALAMAAWPTVASASAGCLPKDGDVLLLLDASYSMLKSAGGGLTRFNAAKAAVQASLAIFPNDRQVALRVFGSESYAGRSAARMDCQDTVLKVPFAQAATNRSFIAAALATTHARGLTLIAHALRQAASDFTNDVAGRTIVLISDGAESCGGDPCVTATRLAREGFVINAIASTPTPCRAASWYASRRSRVGSSPAPGRRLSFRTA